MRAALALWLACLLPGAATAFNLSRDIPPQALQHLPALSAQVRDAFPAFQTPEYFGALIEHESGCPAIRRMCWNQNARLKSQREEGAGLGQLTRAFRADGTERFDALADVKRLDRGLAELTWDNVYSRPDLQMRAMVVMVRQSWNRLAPTVRPGGDVLHFVDAAYNGGLGGLINERRACGLREGCDAHRWKGHVEKVCLKSAKPLYGTRSACDINRHHVHDVVDVRMPKYAKVL
jgi:hypothetical protein